MRKRFLCWAAVSAAVMLLVPHLAVTFVPGDAGMAVCLLLFYVVNPVYAAAAGVAAGRDRKHLWGLPVLTAAFFLLGAWMVFAPPVLVFAAYAGVYLALGLAAMLLCRCMDGRKAR